MGRPTVDTLKGSKHANMKEMRLRQGKEVWRVAFAFDPSRQAVLLVAGDKSGSDQRLFYKRLIDKIIGGQTPINSKSLLIQVLSEPLFIGLKAKTIDKNRPKTAFFEALSRRKSPSLST